MLLDAAVILFFLGGLMAAVIGVILLTTPATFDRLSKIMGRRVSVRQVMKPLELPHYHEEFFYRHHRWTGGLILAGAVFFFGNLVFRFSLDTAVATMPDQDWIWSVVFWTLVTGNICALAIGSVILVRPDALRPLATIANRWISTRRVSRPLDSSHETVDRLAATYPKASGAVLIAAGLFLTTTFGLLMIN